MFIDFDSLCDSKEVLYSAFPTRLAPNLMICYTVPHGHLVSVQRADPGDLIPNLRGPLQILFSVFSGCCIYRRSADVGSLPLLPLAQDLMLAPILKLSFKRGPWKGAGCCDCMDKKKHLRKKKSSVQPFLKIFIIIIIQ